MELNMRKWPEIRGNAQWALSLILLVFMLVTITIGYVLALTASYIKWGCMRLSGAQLNPMKESHLNIWHRFKSNLSVLDADDATSNHGHQTNRESG